ncbi:MFS transporter [Kitasatospora sp. NBC_00315]|uniref:MFS transporter n=1 Tax=Kitasatospora sp. NBC_00315 TaxID=2975963 RepID=UPI0032465842
MSADRPLPSPSFGVRLRESPLFAERARPRGVARWRYAHWLAVGTVCLGAFLGQLTASITALVFPALEHHFGAGPATVEWVALAYLLVLVALLAPIGRLSDLVGRKTMYLWGFAVFALASLGAGFAGSLALLVACRAVQAVGGAMMQANSVALVARGVPGRAMRGALGVQAAAQGLGLALGPTLGGLLVQHASWRWAFWINVPIGVLGILAGWFLLPRTRPEAAPGPSHEAPGRSAAEAPGHAGAPIASGGGRFDLPGLLLLAGASATLLLALSAASGLPVPAWAAVALLLASVVLGHALARREQRAERPIIAPGLVSTPGVRAGLVVALLGYLLLFCPLVLGPMMLAGAGLPTARAGLVITLLPAAFALTATLGGRLLPRHWPDGTRCRWGAGTAGAGLALLALLPAGATLPRLIPPGVALLVIGAGLGLLLPANNALVMRAVPAECSALGGGMVNMVRSLGTALGTALPVLGVHLAGPALGGRAVLLVLVVLAGSAVVLGGAGGGAPGPTGTDGRAPRGRPSGGDRTGVRRT